MNDVLLEDTKLCNYYFKVLLSLKEAMPPAFVHIFFVCVIYIVLQLTVHSFCGVVI